MGCFGFIHATARTAREGQRRRTAYRASASSAKEARGRCPVAGALRPTPTAGAYITSEDDIEVRGQCGLLGSRREDRTREDGQEQEPAPAAAGVTDEPAVLSERAGRAP